MNALFSLFYSSRAGLESVVVVVVVWGVSVDIRWW